MASIITEGCVDRNWRILSPPDAVRDDLHRAESIFATQMVRPQRRRNGVIGGGNLLWIGPDLTTADKVIFSYAIALLQATCH
jgi:hypothetical protein